MNINLINKSSYNIVLSRNDSVISELSANSHINLDVNVGDELTFCPQEHNHVYFNFLFAMIDGFISNDHIVNDLVCREKIYFDKINDGCIIEIYGFMCRLDDKGFIYETVKTKLYGDLSVQTSYQIEPANKEYRKTKLFLYLISSGLPINLVLLAIFLIDNSILIVLAMIGILLVFTIPSCIKVKKLKKYYGSDFANNSILLALEKENIPDPPKNFMDKALTNAVNKVMGRFFTEK